MDFLGRSTLLPPLVQLLYCPVHDSDQTGSAQASTGGLASCDMGRSGCRSQAPSHAAIRQNVEVKDLGVQDLPEYDLLHSARSWQALSPGINKPLASCGIDKPLAYPSDPRLSNSQS